MTTDSTLRIALVMPDLLGTYGDRGNAMILAERASWRGMSTEMVTVPSSSVVPGTCDVYVLGGGEDVAQSAAVRALTKSPGMRRAAERGVPVLGICGGLQVLSSWFVTGDGQRHDGLGLVDASTEPGDRRAIGEITTESALPGIGVLTGFENHLGRTRLGVGAQPLGRITRGVGNGFDEAEGAVHDHIICTYLHGPVLARNPALADLLLEWAVGAPLQAVAEFPELHALRKERTRRPVRQRK